MHQSRESLHLIRPWRRPGWLDEEAVELRFTAILRMTAKHSTAFYLRPTGNGSAKPKRLKRAV